ncbi:MAG: glutathione S-transferase N-terminal domain-containing protein [Gammaproteobacteria bacterium]|nr:glutathione S-transferase N-terminal domain-containing protein [Gammaproteobacteria bacterium]
MRAVIRLFFKLVRLIVTPFLLSWEWLAGRPTVHRSAQAQQRLDAVTAGMTLYQFKTCPFCVKTRIHIKRLGLNIATRDAQHDQQARAELQSGGGKIQVPCLRIAGDDGGMWLYESTAIIAHLDALAADLR